MVAEACYMTPTSCKLGIVAVAHRSEDGTTPKLPSHGISSQDEAKSWEPLKREECEWKLREISQDQERDLDAKVKKEEENEEQADAQNVNDQDDKEALQEEEEEFSSEDCHSEDVINNNKVHGRTNWRKNSLHRMKYCKAWIANNLLLVTTGLHVVSLSDIEEAYHKDCRKSYQEPLTTSVLARIIHQQFPGANKCRLGPRGNQKIHYSKLKLKAGNSFKQHQMNGDALAVTQDKAVNEIPDVNLPQQDKQGKGKKSATSVTPKDIKDPCADQKDGEFQSLKEGLVSEATQQLPKEGSDDQEGCEDAANSLMQLVNSIKTRGKMEMLLQVFAHSSTCERLSCLSLCRMFRRVRRHVVNARHPCHVMRLYSVLLKAHVKSCRNNRCGMTACPALRASQQVKRGRDEEPQQDVNVDYLKDGLQHATKKLSLQGKRPSSLTIRMPSPASSLPDSDASTPSPSVSPSEVLPASPVRMFPVPPNKMHLVPKTEIAA